MIFTPKHAHLVMSGKKTQARRPAGDTTPPYKPGRSYAIQTGVGKTPVGRVEIVAVSPERLGDLTFESARAEGFRTREEFYSYWDNTYNMSDPDLVVWVYIITPTTERRYLAKRMGQGERLGKTRDYVGRPHMAIRDEPEVVPPDYQAKLVEQGLAKWEQDRTDEINALDSAPVEIRLARLRQMQDQGGVNIDRHLKAITSRIEAAEKRAGIRPS